MLEKEIQRHIHTHQLFATTDRLLVALSGGADSVALLRILVSLGYTCEAAHCNFQLRGEESVRDEQFVRSLCERLGVKLHVTLFNTRAYAYNNKVSIEMAARNLRYEWFENLRVTHKFQYVAVAHHQDDSVETFLLNLVRGTGIHGLRGIAEKNGAIVRPLLHVTRSELLDYLDALHQPYVTDSTNLQDEFQRNKIRLHVLPLLRTLNPSVSSRIADTANRLTEVAKVYDQAIRQSFKHIEEEEVDGVRRFSIRKLLREVSPQSILFELLYPLGFNATQLAEIFQSLSIPQSGKRFYAETWQLVRDREHLLLAPRTLAAIPELQTEILDRTPDFAIPRSSAIACLDADKITSPLQIRRCQLGDWFIPLGMKGRKRVSDYLTDRKCSLLEKEQQCVVCCGDDIIWLVNQRCDHRFRITDSTRRILLLRTSLNENE